MENYRKFLSALGLSNADMAGVPLILGPAQYINGMMRMTQGKDWLATVAAVGIASERPIPLMYEKFLAGLRKIPEISEDAL